MTVQKVYNHAPGKKGSISDWLQYVGPLWFHPLSAAVLPSLEATTLKGLFWSSVHLYHCILHYILVTLKMGSLKGSGTPINHKNPCQESRERGVESHTAESLDQVYWTMGWSIAMMQLPLPSILQLQCVVSNCIKNTMEDSSLVLLIDGLGFCCVLMMHYALIVDELYLDSINFILL